MTAAASRPEAKRVCIVTGASGTLGSAFCRSEAHDYDIVAVYNSTVPRPVIEGGAFAIRADLNRDEDVAQLISATLTRFGRIDVVVNAAACAIPQSALEFGVVPGALTSHWRTNVLSPARLALEIVARSWHGREGENLAANRNVVNVSSTAGVYVYSGLGHTAYGTSKAALNFLTAHLASELAPLNVRVNALAPTTFPERIPTQRVVAGALRLAEGDMTGQTLVLDVDEEELM